MAQRGKAPASKSDDLNSVTGSPVVEEESQLSQAVLTSIRTLWQLTPFRQNKSVIKGLLR